MSNPLNEPHDRFFVVVNHEGQYALWPELAQVPVGWTVASGAADRDACIDFVNTHWTDMRPLSLVAHFEARGQDSTTSPIESGGSPWG
ncbi:MbtH family protein [Streptomyces sp. NPDC055085]